MRKMTTGLPLWFVLSLFVLVLLACPLAWAGEDSSADSTAEEEQQLGDILEGASGVRVATMCTNCNIASVTMNGQTGDHVQVLADGIPVAGGLGGIYLFSVAPSESIVKTDIVRGAGTVLTGSDAAVGAVVFKTRTAGKRPEAWASMDIGSFGWMSLKALVSGRKGSVGGVLTATHSRSDGVDANGDGNNNLGRFHRTTVAGDLTWDLAANSTLRAGLNHYDENQWDNKGVYSGTHPPVELGAFHKENVDIVRDEAFLGFEHRFDDGARLSVTSRYTDREQVTDDDSFGLYQRQPYMLVDETILLADARYTRTVWGQHTFTGGVFYQDLDTEGTIWDYPAQHIHDVVEQQAAYAEFEFALPHRFNLTAGVRYDDFGQFGSEVSPRMSLAWKATSSLNAVLSAGYGYSAPRPILERICCGARVQSNSKVRPERSKNALLDLNFVPAPWLKITGSLFRNDYEDFIEKRMTHTTAYFHPTFQQVNYDLARFEGGELSFESRLGDWTFGASASRISARFDDPLKYVIELEFVGQVVEIPIELPAGRILNTPRTQGSASIAWESKERGVQFTLEGQYTGRMLIQELPDREGVSLVTDVLETPSLWVYNVRTRIRLSDHFDFNAGVDNTSNVIQSWLDDPRYEYNWGPLRGRYIWAGLSYAL